VACVVVAVAGAIGYLASEHPSYSASATVSIVGASPSGGAPALSAPNPAIALGGDSAITAAAKLLRPDGLSAVSAAGEVSSTENPTTDTVTVTATAGSGVAASEVANAFAEAYVSVVAHAATSEINTIGTELASTSARIAKLHSELAAGTNPAAPAEITALTSTYSTLAADQAQIEIGGPYASLLSSATPPTSPVNTHKKEVAGLAAVAGLLAGCGIALLRDQMDTRLRSSEEIASLTELPVLAELPVVPKSLRRTGPLVAVSAPHSAAAESFRELRTSLRVVLEDKVCPLIAVTSAGPGEGKTFVTGNLAVSWALNGYRVVLVSADLRRPRIEQLFSVGSTDAPTLGDLYSVDGSAPEGLGSVILGGDTATIGTRPSEQSSSSSFSSADEHSRFGLHLATDAKVRSALVDSGVAGLSLLCSGGPHPSPSELLDSAVMQTILERLRDLADIVLIDTPPVMEVPDAAILGSRVDGTIVVAAIGETTTVSLRSTLERLRSTRARMLGVVLNRATRSNSATYHPYLSASAAWSQETGRPARS
jgi:succinoglycan biosynthesis transport protein ExoP